MLKIRVIPTMLYKDFGLVKGVRFDSRRAVGSPMQSVKIYNLRNVDELVFLDVTATLNSRGPDLTLIDELADECFMPLTVGGGVRSVDDVGALLRVGADKVAVGTALVEHPDAVRQAAARYGSQCIVAAVDFRRGPNGDPRAWIRAGTRDAGVSALELSTTAEGLGVGEILLTSIDRDGTMEGFETDVIAAVCAAVQVPVIASGGAGSSADVADAVRAGASAVAAASIFHFTEQTPLGVKEHLKASGFPVRM